MSHPNSLANLDQTRHGHTAGHAPTAEYRIWCAMKRRCYNPRCRSFADYGARGVTVCKRWLDSFEAFLGDMGPRPGPGYSIDRRENGKGYEPGNCRWATRTEQNRNSSRNQFITLKGETRCLSEWVAILGLNYATVYNRIRRGWDHERALTQPADPLAGRFGNH